MRPPLQSPFDRDPNAPPINPLPPVVWLLVLPILAIEAAFSLAARGLIGGAQGVGWRIDAVRDHGFLPEIWDRMVELGQFPPEHLARFVTYAFVHGGFTHALFVVVFVMALGKFVGEVFRGWAVLAVFLGASVAGALAYGTLLDDPVPLVGGYPGAYGLIGAFTFILWLNLGARGENRARAFTLIGFLLAFQLLFGVLFGGGTQWVADVAGFTAGFLLSFAVSPGGWARLRAKIAQR